MYNWKEYNGDANMDDANKDAGVDETADESKEVDETPKDDDVSSTDAINTDVEPNDNPINYLLTGLILFLTCGPLADPAHRIDFLCVESYTRTGKKDGRSAYRAKERSQKATKRDLERGTVALEDARRYSGITHGAASQQDCVLNA